MSTSCQTRTPRHSAGKPSRMPATPSAGPRPPSSKACSQRGKRLDHPGTTVLAPYDSTVQIVFASITVRTRPDAAIQVLRDLTERLPWHREAGLALCAALLRAGRASEAAAALAGLLARLTPPASPTMLGLFGAICSAAGEPGWIALDGGGRCRIGLAPSAAPSAADTVRLDLDGQPAGGVTAASGAGGCARLARGVDAGALPDRDLRWAASARQLLAPGAVRGGGRVRHRRCRWRDQRLGPVWSGPGSHPGDLPCALGRGAGGCILDAAGRHRGGGGGRAATMAVRLTRRTRRPILCRRHRGRGGAAPVGQPAAPGRRTRGGPCGGPTLCRPRCRAARSVPPAARKPVAGCAARCRPAGGEEARHRLRRGDPGLRRPDRTRPLPALGGGQLAARQPARPGQ